MPQSKLDDCITINNFDFYFEVARGVAAQQFCQQFIDMLLVLLMN